jgi:drug/metabolite transporter (DMT)-like permease
MSRMRNYDFRKAQYHGSPARMNIAKAVLLKLASAMFFAVMSALIRYVGDVVPLGQIIFFRSAFAVLPVVLIYAWRRELKAAVRTNRPLGHLTRGLISIAGMSLNFAGLARLPLVDAIAIGFATPLVTVGMAAVILKERVRIYRWSAVIVGFGGVLVMLTPHLDVVQSWGTAPSVATVGAICAVCAVFANAGSVIQTRRLTDTETTPAIVFYFSLICALGGLLTLPFGWHVPNATQMAALATIGICGGLAHLLLTESFRFAPASLLAPFDYTAMLWAFVLGYLMFGEVPTVEVFIGAAIVTAAGLFVVWRERQLGLQRERAAESPPIAT